MKNNTVKENFIIWQSDYELLLDIYNNYNFEKHNYNNFLFQINNILLKIYKNGFYIDEIVWFTHTNINNPNDQAMGGIKDNKNSNFYFAETQLTKNFDIENYNKIPSYIYNFIFSQNNIDNCKYYPCVSIKKLNIKFVPNKYRYDEKIVLYFLKTKKQITENVYDINSLMTGIFTFNLDNEKLITPCRNYYEEITDEEYNKFNDIQKCILDCIMTLNCNGYIREKHLKNILKTNFGFEQFYIFNLARSYVSEILDIIYNHEKNNTRKYLEFIKQNKEMIQKGYQSMMSYWDLYYKNEFPILKNYSGYKIFREIFKLSRNGKTKL